MPVALPEQKDLVFVVADKDAELAFQGLLSRPQRLGIRPITFHDPVRIKYDNEVPRRCHDYLRQYLRAASYAIVLFDREGCGISTPRRKIESEVERRLAQNGWPDRCAVIVIDPELEAWVWSDSPEVPRVLNWPPGEPTWRNWLVQRGYLMAGQAKPRQPKEALQELLQFTRKRRSSAIYRELAEKVNFDGCVDEAFLKFRSTLQRWFPPA